jgi:hypothetical protein
MPKAKDENRNHVRAKTQRSNLIRTSIEMIMEHAKWIERKKCDVSGDGMRWMQKPLPTMDIK